MKDVTLHMQINRDLWQKFRIIAMNRRITVQALLHEVVQSAVEKHPEAKPARKVGAAGVDGLGPEGMGK